MVSENYIDTTVAATTGLIGLSKLENKLQACVNQQLEQDITQLTTLELKKKQKRIKDGKNRIPIWPSSGDQLQVSSIPF